jgi:hypothetical protein
VVSVGLLLMEDVSPSPEWTALLSGFVVCGVGIGLANPTSPRPLWASSIPRVREWRRV